LRGPEGKTEGGERAGWRKCRLTSPQFREQEGRLQKKGKKWGEGEGGGEAWRPESVPPSGWGIEAQGFVMKKKGGLVRTKRSGATVFKVRTLAVLEGELGFKHVSPIDFRLRRKSS